MCSGAKGARSKPGQQQPLARPRLGRSSARCWGGMKAKSRTGRLVLLRPAHLELDSLHLSAVRTRSMARGSSGGERGGGAERRGWLRSRVRRRLLARQTDGRRGMGAAACGPSLGHPSCWLSERALGRVRGAGGRPSADGQSEGSQRWPCCRRARARARITLTPAAGPSTLPCVRHEPRTLGTSRVTPF